MWPLQWVPAWWQSIIRQDNAGVWKASFPEESIFYSIWYTMETAAEVGWLLHTQKAFLFTWLAVASLQGICILPFLWVCIIICICGQNHLQGQTLLSGIQVQLLWKGTRFGSAPTRAKSSLCQPFIWRYRMLRLQLEQPIDERASEKSLLAQASPFLFSVNSATPRWILQQFPPYCIFTLLVPHSKEKNLQQCHLPSWLKTGIGTKPGFWERGSSTVHFDFWGV